LGQQSPGRVIA